MSSSVLTLLRDAKSFARHRSIALIGNPLVLEDIARREILAGWGPHLLVRSNDDVPDALGYNLMHDVVVVDPAEDVDLKPLFEAEGLRILAVWRRKMPSDDVLKPFASVIDCGPFPSDGKRLVQFVELLADRSGVKLPLDQKVHDLIRVRLGRAQDRIEMELRKIVLGTGGLHPEAVELGLSSHIESDAEVLADGLASGRTAALVLTLGALDKTEVLVAAVRFLAYRLRLAHAWNQESGQKDRKDFCRRHRTPIWRFETIERTAQQFSGDRYARAIDALCRMEEALRMKHGFARTSAVLQAVRSMA